MPSPDTACVRAPASKSISHRYCIGAALAHGTSELHHVLDSRDLECTRAILCSAGARMEALPGEEGGWRVTGMDGRPRGGTDTPLSCDVHESGTTCRLLTAVLAAGHGLFRIHGALRMHERPIDELTRALEALGTDVRFEQRPDCPPLLLRAAGLDPAPAAACVWAWMPPASISPACCWQRRWPRLPSVWNWADKRPCPGPMWA